MPETLPQESGATMWISAGIMLILLIVVYVIAKKQQGFIKGERQLKVIEKLAIGTNRTLMVVKAGEKILLVGVTLQQMTMLAELDHDEWAKVLKDREKGGDGFANILGSFMGSQGSSGDKFKFGRRP